MKQFKIIFSIALVTSIALGLISFTTINDDVNSKFTLHAQLITYQLEGISVKEYKKQMVKPDGPILAKVDGLISKVWLADEEKNSYGGFYVWESKEHMETFMKSDLVKAVVSRPFVTNVNSVDYQINKKASKVTRGLK